MTVRARMMELLGEDIRETEFFRTSSKGLGDAELFRLTASSGQNEIEFLFADSASAKAAAALLKDIGFTTGKSAAAPYFTSASALKESDWYKKEVASSSLANRYSALSKRAKKYDNKTLKLSKTPYPGFKAGVYSFTDTTDGFTLFAHVKFSDAAGTSSLLVKKVEVVYYDPKPNTLDALEQMLDTLDTGKFVDRYDSEDDYAVVPYSTTRR